jgi:hypothetical protein
MAQAGRGAFLAIVSRLCTASTERKASCQSSSTVNPVAPVFHPFSLGNLCFIIYMAELKADEFGVNFHPIYFSHLTYNFFSSLKG